MECAVCYESCRGLKLVCGHAFCHACVKQWCTKGTGTGCPMCRRPVYFKGYWKKAVEWEQEAYENKMDSIVSETINHECEMLQERLKQFRHPFVKEAAASIAMLNIQDAQKTVRVLKEHDVYEDYVEEALYDGMYFSDRQLNKKNQYREKPRRLPEPKNRSRGRPRVYS